MSTATQWELPRKITDFVELIIWAELISACRLQHSGMFEAQLEEKVKTLSESYFPLKLQQALGALREADWIEYIADMDIPKPANNKCWYLACPCSLEVQVASQANQPKVAYINDSALAVMWYVLMDGGDFGVGDTELVRRTKLPLDILRQHVAPWVRMDVIHSRIQQISTGGTMDVFHRLYHRADIVVVSGGTQENTHAPS